MFQAVGPLPKKGSPTRAVGPLSLRKERMLPADGWPTFPKEGAYDPRVGSLSLRKERMLRGVGPLSLSFRPEAVRPEWRNLTNTHYAAQAHQAKHHARHKQRNNDQAISSPRGPSILLNQHRLARRIFISLYLSNFCDSYRKNKKNSTSYRYDTPTMINDCNHFINVMRR